MLHKNLRHAAKIQGYCYIHIYARDYESTVWKLSILNLNSLRKKAMRVLLVCDNEVCKTMYFSNTNKDYLNIFFYWSNRDFFPDFFFVSGNKLMCIIITEMLFN